MLNKKNILITGGTGLIGRKLIDVILKKYDVNIKVVSLDEPKDADFDSIFVTSRRSGSGKVAVGDRDNHNKPAKRRGLSSRNGNIVPSLANLPPPPAL